jgi:hypothetical protein
MPKKSGLPIVGGKPYDPDDRLVDGLSKGIREGLRRRKERMEKEKKLKTPAPK